MRSAKIYQGESSCISPFQDMHIEIFGMFNLEKMLHMESDYPKKNMAKCELRSLKLFWGTWKPSTKMKDVGQHWNSNTDIHQLMMEKASSHNHRLECKMDLKLSNFRSYDLNDQL